MFIRQVEDADLSTLHDLDVLVFGEIAYPEFTLRELADVHRRHFLVADTGVGLVGYALAGFAAGAARAHLLRLGVHPDQRARGYGRVLLRRCLTSLARDGAAEVALAVDPSESLPALGLFESTGFAIEDLAFDGSERHRYRMSVRLSTGLIAVNRERR